MKRKGILFGAAQSLIIRVMGLGLGYLFLLLVSRKTTAEVVGLFSISITLLLVISLLCRLGLDIGLMRFIARNPTEKAKGAYLKTIALVVPLSLFFSILLFLFSGVIASSFQSPELIPYLKTTALVLTPFTLLFISSESLRGLGRINLYMLLRNNGLGVYLVSLLIFILCSRHGPLFAYSIGIILSISLAILFLTWSFRKKAVFTTRLTDILKSSIPIMFVSSMVLIMGWTDTLMLGFFRTEAETGIYNVVLRLSEVGSVFLISVNSFVAPRFAKLKTDKLKTYVNSAGKIIFFASLPVIIILGVFAPVFLSIFGPEFLLGKDALLVLLAGQVVNVLCGSVAILMQMTGYEKPLGKIVFVSALLNLLLNLLTIPAFGILGAAISSTSSLILWNILALAYMIRKTGISTLVIPLPKIKRE